MINLKLIRNVFATNYTQGIFYVNGLPLYFTVEDTVREAKMKVKHLTAIPVGTYKVRLEHSPKFGRIMPHILDVPNFEGILIHWGNSASDSSGCPIIGLNKWQHGVADSKLAFNQLMEILKRDPDIELQII